MSQSHLSRKPVLVMGAAGSVGAHVLAELLARGVPVRASVRRPESARLPAGLDVRAADLTDPTTLEPAFEGVGAVFLYANHRGVQGLIDSARRAGVERIVMLSSGSVIHPTSRGNAITEEHRQVEEAFAASGLEVVPVRPLVLATNALNWAHPVKAGSVLPLYRPDALTAPIHERDIAAVAVAALEGAAGVSGLLTGPSRITQRAQVAALAAAIGREIPVHELDRDGAAARLSQHMPDREAEAVLQFLDDAAAGNSPATTTVSTVLGRPALDFDAWALEHADAFRADR